MTLEQLKIAFADLRAAEWIESRRRGPTGIGQTLEQALGLTENNIAAPDLGTVELKAHCIGSSSRITLFTFNRKVWRMKPLDAVRAHGTLDADGRMGLYYTMTRTPNGTGLFLHIESDTVSVRHVSGVVLAEWQLEVICERFLQKLPGLVLVSAFSEMRGDKEWFRFSRAQLLEDTSTDVIREQFLAGNIVVDLRLHEKATSARNHGTAFRVREDRLPSFFKTVQEL